ncbi:2Fe-2S iron-sulfur cluster-binding protein [Undibacterium sp. TJN25]|uniref:2Fe-2S iron-sulfur cluster-binding protein n=1 Tax=Undibacterium sp. TJN25 TaxID=3413056 RepID=UPI003BF31C71
MPHITYILKDGARRELEVKAGATVMEAAIHNNVRGIDAECGGSMSCATCHVYVAPEFFDRLAAPDPTELALLEGVAAEQRATSRLSCQIVITADLDGLVVHVPERQG